MAIPSVYIPGQVVNTIRREAEIANRRKALTSALGTPPIAPAMPVRRAPIGSSEALPLLIAGVLAKFAGVNDRDISEFGHGFLGARTANSDADFESAMNQAKASADAQNAASRAAMSANQFEYENLLGEKAQEQAINAARANQRYDEQQSALDRGSREGIAKMTQEGLSQRAEISAQAKARDSRIRAFNAVKDFASPADLPALSKAFIDMPDEIAATLDNYSTKQLMDLAGVKQREAQTGLTVAKTDTERKMLPGKLALQKLNIDNFQEITKAKLALAAAHTSQAYEMINRYQEMTAQGWAGLDIAQQKIAAGSYDDAVKEWKDGESSLKSSMDALHKEAEAARKELSAATLMRGLSENDQQRAAYDAQIAALNERIQSAQNARSAAEKELKTLRATKPSPPPVRASSGSIGRKAPARTREIDTSGGFAPYKPDLPPGLPKNGPATGAKPPAKKNKVKWGG